MHDWVHLGKKTCAQQKQFKVLLHSQPALFTDVCYTNKFELWFDYSVDKVDAEESTVTGLKNRAGRTLTGNLD